MLSITARCEKEQARYEATAADLNKGNTQLETAMAVMLARMPASSW